MPVPTLGQPGYGMDLKNRFRGVAFANPDIQNVPTPLSVSTNAITLTAQQVINSIFVNGGSTATVTLPSAAALRQGLAAYLDLQGVQVGDTIGLLVCNSTGLMSLVGGTGGSADANGATTVLAGQSKNLLFRFTNVTPGSEAYIFYA
jgi:hypothetical protein